MDDPDLQLLDRWREGDAIAGNTLFQRHFESLYRFFERKTDGDADDLVQETMLGCLKSIHGFQRQSSFRTYLFAVARHTLFGYWRARAPNRSAIDFDDLSIASLSTTAGTKLDKETARTAVLLALQSLPLDQQLLLEMFYWQELDRKQIAEIYCVAEATVGTRLFRARAVLENKLSKNSTVQRAEINADPDAFRKWMASFARRSQ